MPTLPDDRNYAVKLVSYPQGFPRRSDFSFVEGPIPEPREGEFLVRSIMLSLDPWQWLRMRPPAKFGRQYAKPILLEETIPGYVLAEVVQSRSTAFHVGEVVEGKFGWQRYATSNGYGDRSQDAAGVSKVNLRLGTTSMMMSVLGRTGISGYFAVLDLGDPTPGETVLVTAAAGATGSVAGQVARIAGCRVVGLAGSDAKVDFIVNELGFDAGINYKVSQSRLHEELKAKCPDGIDLFIDNVGGPVADAMLEHMNDWGRWIIIGLIGDYDRPISENTGLKPQGYVLGKRLRMQGFVVHDYAPRYAEAQKRLSSWIREGRLKFREHIVGGLENAPAAFLDMLAGGNVGKVLVRTGPDPIGAA